MEFKYQLGDRVALATTLDAVIHEITYERTVRLDTMRIIERVSCECVGGTQLFYRCERWDSNVGLYAEGSVVPADDAWTKWIDAVNARAEKKGAV